MCINMYKTNLVKIKIEELERRIFFLNQKIEGKFKSIYSKSSMNNFYIYH